MKKILVVLLTLVFLLSLASCDFIKSYLPQGPQGIPGEKGDKGDTGLQGDKGDKGDTGATIQKIAFDELGRMIVTLTDGTVLEPIEMAEKVEHSHIFGEWTLIKQANCSEGGVELRFCSVCNGAEARFTETVPVHDHQPSITEPTCTERGVITYTCRCGDTYSEEFGTPLTHAEYEACPHTIQGKKISFMGDSISTYLGWNNNTAFNSTIGSNAVYYEAGSYKEMLTSVHYTYWMRVVDELNLSLCVNNSWSGSFASTKAGTTSAGCMNRTQNLHNDHTGEKPDIIVIYLGTNDFNNDVPLGSFSDLNEIYNTETGAYVGNLNQFAPAYATMVHKVQNNYPDAEIYLCTVDAYKFRNGKDPYAFNQAIEYIADYFDCMLVDFYGGTSISVNQIGAYTTDSYLHPNAKGMTQMADCIKAALAKKYRFPEQDLALFDQTVLQEFKISSLSSCNRVDAPWTYLEDVNQKLSGKTVTRIGVPIKALQDHTKDNFFTVHIIDAKTFEIQKSIQIVVPANRFLNNTVNQWEYFEVEIKLGENEALAFVSPNDTVDIGYSGKPVTTIGGLIQLNNGGRHNHISILFDVFYKEAEN